MYPTRTRRTGLAIAMSTDMLLEDGTATAVGTRDDVLPQAGDHVPVIAVGRNVGFPGFIDAHAREKERTARGGGSSRPWERVGTPRHKRPTGGLAMVVPVAIDR